MRRNDDPDIVAAWDELHAATPLGWQVGWPSYHERREWLPYAFDPYVTGFPTTLLYDKAGQERARLIGEADWSTPEAIAVVDHLLALN